MYAPHDTRARNLVDLLDRVEAAATPEDLLSVVEDAFALETGAPCGLSSGQASHVIAAATDRLDGIQG